MSSIRHVPDKILAYRPCEGKEPQYLVKFVGLGVASAQWMVRSDINNDIMVDTYRGTAKLDMEDAKLQLTINTEGVKKDVVDDDSDDDKSWMLPARGSSKEEKQLAPHLSASEIKPFALDTDTKAVTPDFVSHVAVTSWGGVRPSDLLAADHAHMLVNDYMIWRSQPMAVPQSTMFRTTGSVRLPRVRTKRAEVLARSNCRYLLGCLIAAGFSRATIALDMFAYEEVVRALLVCVDARRLGCERRYQLVLELRTITWWIASRQPARIGLDRVASAAFVEGLLADCGKEKRDAAKKREHIDTDEMTKQGKWLTLEDQTALTRSITAYFHKDQLNPKYKVMTDEAWKFQGHLILHLLNDNIIAVPRSELLGSIQRGSSCVFDKDANQWIFKVSYGQTKTKAPTLLRLPVSSNMIMKAWFKYYRPALVGEAKHEYVFVNKNGSAPRQAFGAQVRALQEHYIGKSVSPHTFRGLQASSAQADCVTSEENAALCWSRQHSVSTSKKFYEKTNQKRMAELSEKVLSEMRAKRRKLIIAGDTYEEVDVDQPLDEE